jgi:hypothetical protein
LLVDLFGTTLADFPPAVGSERLDGDGLADFEFDASVDRAVRDIWPRVGVVPLDAVAR